MDLQKILVVDDDPIVQTLVRNILERSGFEVMTAASGEDALNLINLGRIPHIAIVDINMPPGHSGCLFRLPVDTVWIPCGLPVGRTTLPPAAPPSWRARPWRKSWTCRRGTRTGQALSAESAGTGWIPNPEERLESSGALPISPEYAI